MTKEELASISERCMICDSNDNTVIAKRIREKSHHVLRCNNCDFVFLENYREIDYSCDYGGLTLSSEWSREDALIKRSKSLRRFNQVVSRLINNTKNFNVLEIGAGCGASVYGLNKLVDGCNIDCVEVNIDDQNFIKEHFFSSVYNSISGINKEYQVIFGHHVFEHFIDPKSVLNEISLVATDDCKLYFSLPNFDDFYADTLNSEQKRKYLEFNFHLAHPYYYTKSTFSKLIENTGWKISEIATIQEYSVLNYFNWYINGERSKDIEHGTIVNKNINELNKNFINSVEEMDMGNNLSVILEKAN